MAASYLPVLLLAAALAAGASFVPLSYSDYPPPLQQIRDDGVDPEDVQCNTGLVHAVRANGAHVCVKETTAERLGWEIFVAEDTQPGGASPSPSPVDMQTANNGFAVEFYKRLPVGENTFFSPTSMYVAFSALYEGAKGDTAAQMQDVFGLDPNDETRRNSTAHAMASINRDDPDATLEMANALWVANWFEPYQSYLDVARGTYLADVETVDFEGGGADKINQWASDKTHGKIKKVIDSQSVDEFTAMVISNAIYFKGTWVTQFPESDTRESAFWTSDTENVTADFMNVRGEFEYIRSDGSQVLKMPYEGDRLSMLVILPDERSGLVGLAETLSAEQIAEWSEGLRHQEVVVSVPKFEMRKSYGLNPILMGMGMTDAFNKKLANLTGIAQWDRDPIDIALGDFNLFVDSAKQYTYINVDEEGTEAAAVTTIEIGITESLEPTPITTFVADHPFLFVIQDDETGMILFMGSVVDTT